MKMFKHLKETNESGFSLVELMIVVGIIGVLATLAVPRFQQFQAKARAAESKNMLNHIYTLEESYHLENNLYQNFTIYGRNTTGILINCTTPPAGAVLIGFSITPCAGAVPRFGYSVTGSTNVAFVGHAQLGAGNANLVCGSANAAASDTTITQDRVVTNPANLCP